jgi:CO/xanthine dehydrogenase Mo-binding subunit
MLSKKFAFIAPAFLACTFASAALAIEPPANGGQDPAQGPGQGPGGKEGGKDGGKGGERKRPDFKTLDKNGDGFITEDEAPAQAWERMKKFDANGDGKISADEMTKGMADWQLVFKTLKEKSGFRTDLPKGQGMGIAAVESHGTIAAACATVSVSKRGELTIEKLVVVLDAGHVINPHAATEQAEGSVVWELSHAFLGGLELEDGRFVNTNFATYNLMRINQTPVVET